MEEEERRYEFRLAEARLHAPATVQGRNIAIEESTIARETT